MPNQAPVDLVVLDVNETLFSLDPIASRMAEVGLTGELPLWFAHVLRDGIAAAAAGTFVGFRELADHHLRARLRHHGRPVRDASITHVLQGFEEVGPHPDVPAGLRTLRDLGMPTVALTNGSAEITRSFLRRAGLDAFVDGVHDVTEVGRWKPAPTAYRAVLDPRDLAPGSAAMVAAHPWDLHGAKAVGLTTAWLDRSGEQEFPPGFAPPDVRATGLGQLARLLSERGSAG